MNVVAVYLRLKTTAGMEQRRTAALPEGKMHGKKAGHMKATAY